MKACVESRYSIIHASSFNMQLFHSYSHPSTVLSHYAVKIALTVLVVVMMRMLNIEDDNENDNQLHWWGW